MEEEKIYITKGDAVLALLEKGQHSKRYKLGESWELNFFEIQEAIDAMPATDVQPVKHGHWIEEVREVGGFFKLYQTYIHCSECGKEHYSGTLPKPNFCDNCGADMRGEGNA